MKFLFSDLTICRALESFGIKETKPWIDRIRDDFEEKMSNNEIVARFLEIQPNKIFQFVNDTLLVDEFVRRIKKPEWVVQDCENLMIRVRVLAYIITNDALNFSHYTRIWEKEPGLYRRFNNIYFDNNTMFFSFEEQDE